MNAPSNEFLRTDFGHEVYDTWYLGHGRYSFESPEFVERHFSFYEKALLLSEEDKILEAGCGIGSYSREFARRGYNVAGMDLSSMHLPSDELKACLVAAGFMNFHFYKKRGFGDFRPTDDGFSVVAKK